MIMTENSRTLERTVTPYGIFTQAQEAALSAARAEDSRLPPEQSRGLDCGFAWVVIRPAKGDFVKWCKANNIGSTRDYGGGGFQIWYSEFDNTGSQSISVHMAAAEAFAAVLRGYGLNAIAGSRLD